MNKTLTQWAVRYRSWAQQRFNSFSRGGGNWKPLAPSTIKRRRGAGKMVSILRDIGLLFGALAPAFQNAPGQFEARGPWRVEVGYGGNHKYPNGNVTIADIASFHHFGTSRIPKREIIVDPPSTLVQQMREDARRNLLDAY